MYEMYSNIFHMFLMLIQFIKIDSSSLELNFYSHSDSTTYTLVILHISGLSFAGKIIVGG